MSKENILKEVIEGYRDLIYHRYQYQNIKDKYEIPDTITEETVNLIRDYFLEYIYPDFSKRQELNEAFDSLDSYIKRPEKLFRMLVDSIKLFFTHGRQLPKILNAGLKAIKSFRNASQLESQLAEKAIKNGISPPFDEAKIKTLLQSIPRHEIDEFIENSESLLQIFQDKKLIIEVIEILEYLISSMKAKRNLYSNNEVRGIELGLEMINQGTVLFDRFKLDDQQLLIQLIIKTERSILDELFQQG